MAAKVILHVGTPKTGTSLVQDLLFGERDLLRQRGILYSADRFDAHFLAALDLMQLPWGGLEREAVGAWDRLAREVRAWPDTAIVSHEILATASRGHARRALESLAGDASCEIHLVCTARDLVRQLPAEWQENLKHRRTTTYANFLSAVRDPGRESALAQWFWGVQEIPEVLDRWGSTLPKEHVHLVTVPPSGAPRDLLWQRFAGVLGLDPHEFSVEEGRANASLGVPETALLRRLNERLAEVLPNQDYRALVREHLVHQNLSLGTGSSRLAVPPDVWSWAHELSRAWVAELALRGYDVVGDLDDLLPVESTTPFVDPDVPDEAELAEVGVRALAAMTLEGARQRELEATLHEDIADLMRQLDAAHSTRIYKIKERLVGMASNNPAAAKGLAVYRRLRARNSRST